MYIGRGTPVKYIAFLYSLQHTQRYALLYVKPWYIGVFTSFKEQIKFLSVNNYAHDKLSLSLSLSLSLPLHLQCTIEQKIWKLKKEEKEEVDDDMRKRERR
jgi:hypothetical protein